MNTARIERTIVIVTILFINICLLVPVWQSATNSQLKGRLLRTEELLRAKEDQKMVLRAEIAMRTTPEYLIEQSEAQNIVFTQIVNETTTHVASSDI